MMEYSDNQGDLVVSNKDAVAKWMTRVSLAQSKRNRCKESWDDNYKSVFGDDYERDGMRSNNTFTTTAELTKRRYTYDILLAFLKTEIPSCVMHTPQIFLTSRERSEVENPEAQAEAKKLEAYTNRILADMDTLDTEILNTLTDAFCAYGIFKTVRNNKITPHPKAGVSVTDAAGREVLDLDTGMQILYPGEISEPGYSICRVSPFDFLIDERTRNHINHASWTGEEINRTLEEVVNSGIYDAEIIDKLRANLKQQEGVEDWEIEVTLYEIYDRANRKILVICDEWQDDFIRYEDMPEWIDGDPYTVLKFTEIPGQWYPKPEISPGVVLQDEYRSSWELLRSWAKKANPQLGIKRSFYEGDPSEAKKVGDGTSSYVVVNSESDVFVLNKDALNANVSLREHMSLCMKDFDQIMGQASQDRGLVGGAKFATEAAIAERQGTAREEYRVRQVVSFISKTIEKLLFLIKTNQSEPDEIRNLAINIDVDIEVDIESRSNKSKAVERKQLNEFLVILSSSPLIMQSKTLLDQVFMQYNIKEAAKIIEELTQAVQAEQQQAEQQQVQPQVPESGGGKLSLSLALKHELLPPQAIDRIVDIIMGEDIPIVGAPVASLSTEQVAAMPQAGISPREIDFNSSPAEGTEGITEQGVIGGAG